jgi:mannose-1-phosphate guanylyltransferase
MVTGMQPMSNRHIGKPITPVILVGGSGERLKSRFGTQCPKQFIKCARSQTSLFQQTCARVQNKSLFYASLIVANNAHRGIVKQQGHFNHTCIFEPVGRNTSAAVIISAIHLNRIGRKNMVVLPSDHVIQNTDRFHNTIIEACLHMGIHNNHVLIGVKPQYPSDALGYIQTNCFGNVVFFQEKPDLTTARDLIASHPETYWNSGISCLNISLLLSELSIIAPDFLRCCEQAYSNPTIENYMMIEDKPFDKLYLEHSHSLFCIPAQFDWIDIGMNPDLLLQKKAA